MAEQVLFAGVGDVVVNRADPDEAFVPIAPLLASADLVFGNCEAPCSTLGEPSPSVSAAACRGAPAGLAAMARAGFDAMGFCSNHCLDYGYAAAFETVEGLARNGVKAVGFGADLAAARAPAILEVKGVKVGFLAYTTVAPAGYGAADGKPGCATLRVHTVFEYFHEHQPGTDGSVLTIADPRDVAAMQDAIAALKREADVVVVSLHWGVHVKPVLLADYEMQVGRAAIDAGADLVLGHHQHIPKAIEVYKGRAIFHGLGNFVFDLGLEDLPPALLAKLAARSGPPQAAGKTPARPWAFSEDCRQTLVVLARLGKDGVAEVGYRPCLINTLGQPTPLLRGEADFQRIAAYVEQVTREAGFETRFTVTGDEVRVETG
jgi:poly-gamma-glutamate capsule biosynthesis protein CapA/YwtB (metallophosphatase superfamily)